MTNAQPDGLPTDGPGLATHVVGEVTRLAVLYQACGCHQPTTADALVMGAVAAALNVRGPDAVAASLRHLAAALEADGACQPPA